MATTKTTSVNPEFLYVSIGNIVVLEQVRSNINIELDSFKSFIFLGACSGVSVRKCLRNLGFSE